MNLREEHTQKRYTAERDGWAVSVYESALGGYGLALFHGHSALHHPRQFETPPEAAAHADRIIEAMGPVMGLLK